MRLAPLLLAAVVALAGCGGDGDQTVEAGSQATTTSTVDPPPTTTTPTSTTIGATPVNPATGEISLTVRVVSQGAPLRDATITCGGDPPAGTGYLAEAAAAQAACDLLRNNPAAANRLVNGREPGLMCTQQYGGPEEASVKGTIAGRRIDTTINRRDGCGIAEWNLLTPLLGSPNT